MRSLIFFPFFLYACGSETPSFVEIPEGIITLNVNDEAQNTNETSFGVDETSESEGSEDSGRAADAVAYADDQIAADRGAAAAAEGSQEVRSAAATSTSDSGGTVDAATVAKACAPHFRGLAQNIKVVDADAGTLQLTISPNTVVAFKVAGHQTKLTINLPAGHDIPGVCFFVSGNKANVSFSSSSRVDGFTYLGRGDQSSGTMEFLGGSPVQAHVELKGRQPTLKVQGLDPDLCKQERISCNP